MYIQLYTLTYILNHLKEFCSEIFGVGKAYIMKAAVNELQMADPYLRILFYAPTGAELKGNMLEIQKKI